MKLALRCRIVDSTIADCRKEVRVSRGCSSHPCYGLREAFIKALAYDDDVVTMTSNCIGVVYESLQTVYPGILVTKN